MQIARLPDIDDNTWAEVKAYVEGRHVFLSRGMLCC